MEGREGSRVFGSLRTRGGREDGHMAGMAEGERKDVERVSAKIDRKREKKRVFYGAPLHLTR